MYINCIMYIKDWIMYIKIIIMHIIIILSFYIHTKYHMKHTETSLKHHSHYWTISGCRRFWHNIHRQRGRRPSAPHTTPAIQRGVFFKYFSYHRRYLSNNQYIAKCSRILFLLHLLLHLRILTVSSEAGEDE